MSAVKRTRASRPPLTEPVEDYLKAIYEIERTGAAASTNDIAQRLSIAPASVTGMVRRLAGQGLLAYERYRGVRLTDNGRQAALRTIRRHRVIESYLTHALGYEWDRVHEEAERLEHAASDELVDRMAAAIGDPDADPHGAPIPRADGTIDETASDTLADLQPGARARIARVSDENGELLRYLDELGMRPGVRVRVDDVAPFDGPITLVVGSVRRTVGLELARHIFVTPDP